MGGSDTVATPLADVILVGLQPEMDRETAVRRLAALFRKEPAAVEKILAKGRYVVKRDAPEDLARKYQASIEKAGGRCELNVKAIPRPALVVVPPASEQSLYQAPSSELEIKPQAFCRNCGASINADLTRCPHCNSAQIVGVPKSKTTAALLALFVGGLGIHRFYLGQWWGVFYLLFWTTLIPSVISLIEAVVFFATSHASWQRKYGNVPANSGVIVAAVCIGLFIMIGLVGIIAAIALPAYQDYTVRAKVASAMPLVRDTQHKVEDFIQRTHFYPNQNIDAGLPESISSDVVESIEIRDNARMVVTFRINSLNQAERTIEWVPKEVDGKITWSCLEGTLPHRYRTRECRGADAGPNGSGSAASSETRLMRSSDGTFSIRMPTRLRDQQNLHEEALIQAANPFDEIYFIAMKEPKTDFVPSFTVGNYGDVVVSSMSKALSDARREGETRSLTIGALPGEQIVLSGAIDGVKVTYLITVVEGRGNFYQLLSWTLESRFDRHRSLMESIPASFSEQ